jgi:pimeloyl-ACP methyl ester carboxylesterase
LKGDGAGGAVGWRSGAARSLGRRLFKLALIMLLLYGLLCALMFTAQRRLQYGPDPSAVNVSPDLPGVRAETLVTGDGERLAAWWVAPRRADAPVYLYLHGNGGKLDGRTRRLAWLVEGGAGVLAVSWRGYGGSTGSPHEAGLLDDARSAYRVLAARVDPARIVLFGESLGSTVAVMLAAEVRVAGVVLDSSFASALEVAQGAYPWLPVRWLLRDTYRADRAASRVDAPVLQVHCAEDPVTPLASAKRLQARLPGRPLLVVLPGRCHVVPLDRYEPALQRFIAGLGLR